MLTKVKVIKTKPNSKIPTYGSSNAAGADLYACLSEEQLPVLVIKPTETKMVSVGIKTEFNSNYVALLHPRSGIATKRGLALANAVGVVDSDYRGEWFVPIHNYSNQDQIIEDGERIAQVLFQEIERPIFEESEEISETERGEGGFGSTGKK